MASTNGDGSHIVRLPCSWRCSELSQLFTPFFMPCDGSIMKNSFRDGSTRFQHHARVERLAVPRLLPETFILTKSRFAEPPSQTETTTRMPVYSKRLTICCQKSSWMVSAHSSRTPCTPITRCSRRPLRPSEVIWKTSACEASTPATRSASVASMAAALPPNGQMACGFTSSVSPMNSNSPATFRHCSPPIVLISSNLIATSRSALLQSATSSARCRYVTLSKPTRATPALQCLRTVSGCGRMQTPANAIDS
mmetsp:Transcript_71573/g.159156  ORF Transcript_71573/g.159156 Transcript_71573/m.159156 type:complete len:252 (+) Transcript_71573:2137-2892(+)